MAEQVVKQIGGLLDDLNYLSMMNVLEEQQELRPQHPHIVPITGLVHSSIVRLQNECTTVLELWSHLKRSSVSCHSEEVTETEEDEGVVLDEHGRNALHQACQPEGSLDEVKSLLDSKTLPVNMRDNTGNTALHYLVTKSLTTDKEKLLRKKLVKKVIELRGDINRTNQSGETPLYWSLQQSDESVSYLLLKMKANPTIRSWYVE